MLFQIQSSLSFKGSEQTLESTTEQDCFLNIIKKIGHHFLTLKILNGIYKGQQLEADGVGLDFIGKKPEGVPEDVDDMVRTQVTPEQEVIYAQKINNVCSIQATYLCKLSYFPWSACAHPTFPSCVLFKWSQPCMNFSWCD